MTRSPSPYILVTNDDGVTSPGLHALSEAMRALGDVSVVAPEVERSAVGHAITRHSPLQVKEFRQNGRMAGYAVNGTPADCVKLAVSTLLERRPDLVVSGINLGPNTATNIIYSGTVSAATEARILGIQSMAISVGTFQDPIWETSAIFAQRFARLVLEQGLPPKVLLNVNVPNLALGEVKGVRVTRQGDSRYEDRFESHGDSRSTTPTYQSAASYRMSDVDEATDALALAQGFVSVTPISYDLTSFAMLDELSRWELS
ncbi:MAG TPA: 5'/3'-nucleotidase SurE [Candidatus Dormibacteraeota bacterium]|nr:5'/3'-nucleotidase SurE [Candidatus Dormibacteraeota bacterium]